MQGSARTRRGPGPLRADASAPRAERTRFVDRTTTCSAPPFGVLAGTTPGVVCKVRTYTVVRQWYEWGIRLRCDGTLAYTPAVTSADPATRPIGPYERLAAEVHEWDPNTVEVARRVG